jgi:uncharacterized membrane protein
MIIMALDHVRDYFHADAFVNDPMDAATTTAPLFFTRWITHFCAPVFVFLAGTSIYLQGQRKSDDVLSVFLLKRGLWLIFIECTVVTMGWTFSLDHAAFILQVIWAIGISMVCMGALVRLPFRIVVAIGVAIVGLHNILDYFRPEQPGFIRNLLHDGNFVFYPLWPGHGMLMVYPFLPWLGLMILGYGLGKFYSAAYDPAKRRQLFIKLGWSTIVVFIILRAINLYGDPLTWTTQATGLATLFSFLNVQKYPPSLLFTCMTIGPALLALAYFEKLQGRLVQALSTYGRVPFLYYIVHIYFIHLLATVVFFARGHSLADESFEPDFPFKYLIIGEGFSLPMVYLIWIGVVLALYPLVRWFSNFKRSNPQLSWLSYF